MQLLNTCKHCEEGRFGVSVCPSCWGTTVAPAALAEAKLQLARAEEAYEEKRKANEKLRGRARGFGGHALSKIGEVKRALEAEVQRIETEITTNKAVARVVGIAASG